MVANHILAKYTGSGDPSKCDALHCIDYFKSQYPDPDGLRALFIALDEKLNALGGARPAVMTTVPLPTDEGEPFVEGWVNA